MEGTFGVPKSVGMDAPTTSYAVILEPEAEGGFSVVVPALPEAHTLDEIDRQGPGKRA